MARLILTPEETVAARQFRDAAQEALRKSLQDRPPTYVVQPNLTQYPHKCAASEDGDIFIPLKAKVIQSPTWGVFTTEPTTQIPLGRFSFTWREGTCRFCGQTARSGAGMLGDPWAPARR